MFTQINPFVPSAPFLYLLKTSENLTVFWCFQGVEKEGCFGNEWVKVFTFRLLKEYLQSSCDEVCSLLNSKVMYCRMFKSRNIISQSKIGKKNKKTLDGLFWNCFYQLFVTIAILFSFLLSYHAHERSSSQRQLHGGGPFWFSWKLYYKWTCFRGNSAIPFRRFL